MAEACQAKDTSSDGKGRTMAAEEPENFTTLWESVWESLPTDADDDDERADTDVTEACQTESNKSDEEVLERSTGWEEPQEIVFTILNERLDDSNNTNIEPDLEQGADVNEHEHIEFENLPTILKERSDDTNNDPDLEQGAFVQKLENILMEAVLAKLFSINKGERSEDNNNERDLERPEGMDEWENIVSIEWREWVENEGSHLLKNSEAIGRSNGSIDVDTYSFVQIMVWMALQRTLQIIFTMFTRFSEVVESFENCDVSREQMERSFNEVLVSFQGKWDSEFLISVLQTMTGEMSPTHDRCCRETRFLFTELWGKLSETTEALVGEYNDGIDKINDALKLIVESMTLSWKGGVLLLAELRNLRDKVPDDGISGTCEKMTKVFHRKTKNPTEVGDALRNDDMLTGLRSIVEQICRVRDRYIFAEKLDQLERILANKLRITGDQKSEEVARILKEM